MQELQKHLRKLTAKSSVLDTIPAANYISMNSNAIGKSTALKAKKIIKLYQQSQFEEASKLKREFMRGGFGSESPKPPKTKQERISVGDIHF